MRLKKGWYWPLLLGVWMAGIVGVNSWMLVVANGDANGAVVEPDYYRKAVAWDSTMAARAASAALGWRADVTVDAPTLEVRLVDAAGAGITGATVSATLIHNADAARHIEVALRELGEGRYAASPTLAHRGLWEVRIAAVRGASRFVETRHAELGPRALARAGWE